MEEQNISKTSTMLFESIVGLVEKTRSKAAVFLNTETAVLYWSIGNFIHNELKLKGEISYGKQILVTLSQQLSWSHFVELTSVDNETKRLFYTQLGMHHHISVDAVDYHLDLLFYHRKIKRLVAIDLKLGKFKPEYKAQMELYLQWLKKKEMQEGEQKPIGLLLCSEGNTEHIELLMLDEKDIKVAQYLTELPSKAWFAEKLHRAMEIAKSQNTTQHEKH